MTLLRMLAFRPKITGQNGNMGGNKSGTASGPGKAGVKTATGKLDLSNALPASRVQAARSESEAAKAARAAFDDLQNPRPAAAPEPVPTKTKVRLEEQPACGPGQAAGSDDPARDWSNLQTRLTLSGAAREFARQIQLESIDETSWTFLVPDSLQHLGSDSVLQNLRTALSSHLGHEVKLDLHGVSKPLDSVAEAATRAEVKRMSEAERAIEEDLTVQQIKKEFGAKIVTDSIQPIQ
jgi:DNA polymerase-3 subunit gamma/tau